MTSARNFLALAALALAVSGCGSQDGGDGGLGQNKAGVFSQFDPVAASPAIPFPFDGLFAGFNDPTLNIPNAGNVPFVTAANLQDGYSTTASAFTDFIGFVDFSTLAAGVVVIDGSTGAPLHPGVDYTFQSSTARDGTGAPISAYRSRVLIEPLRPLKPSTRYIVAVTAGVKSRDGVAASPSDLFVAARSGTPVSQQTLPALSTLTAAQKDKLEIVRSQLIRPLVQALGGAGIPEQAIVVAWSFTTQSIGKTLSVMSAAATAQPLKLVYTGLRTGAAPLSAIPPGASVFVGTLTIPYYLSAPSVAAPTAPLTDFWLADATRPDTSASFLGQVPCGAFAAGVTLPDGQTARPSVSTTICYPFASKRSDQVIPVIATVPTGGDGNPLPTPAGGWPVVIFQHGITGNRSQMLAIAPALSQAGFAVVAIDLPLHGLPPGDALRGATDGFPAPLRPTERTFDVDYVNNATSAPGPDGTVDASGTHFINLASLITSRDNLREAVVDLSTLSKSLGGSVQNLDGSTNAVQFNTGAMRYVGHSLGGIVGGTWLGTSTSAGAATLAMPGGGTAKLLDASGAFGPRIAAGLAASGVIEGTDNYETFTRFAQTLVDSGDPINYAAAAAANHPIHLIEVIGDAVVPNDALSNCASITPSASVCDTAQMAALHKDKVLLSGYLSGTDPLIAVMGLSVVGPIDVPVATAQLLLGPAARNVAVKFSQGEHGTILTPDESASPGPDANLIAVTQEMQRETVNFLASNGACLPIGRNCPAP